MRLDSTQLAISKTCESSFNTPETVAANYQDLPTTEAFFVLPKVEKVSDAARIGRNAATHLCNTYWQHTEATIKDDLNSGVAASLVRRGLGGTVTPVLVAAGVYDKTFAILPPQVGSILPSFNIVAQLGAADFLLSGMMTDKLKFSQKGADRVQYESNVVGSGKFLNPSGIVIPAPVDVPCFDGFRTVVKYMTEGKGATVNLSDLGKLLEWSLEHDNKIQRNKRRTGDPIQTVSGASAAHVRRQPRGKYETKGQILLDFDDLNDWINSVKNAILEDLSFLTQGTKIANVAGTDYYNEVEIIVPKFSFDSPDTGNDSGDATTPIGIVPLEDPVTKGTFKMRVRSAAATLA